VNEAKERKKEASKKENKDRIAYNSVSNAKQEGGRNGRQESKE